MPRTQETEEKDPVIPEDDFRDPDEEAAEKAKEKAKERKAPKPAKTRNRTIQGKKGKPRPCKRCKKEFSPADPRTQYCQPCAREIKVQAGKDKGGRPPLVREEIEELLKPFLRIGLNLKEACLEAEVDYSTILEKKKEWDWFGDFIERHKNYVVVKAKRNLFALISDIKHKEAAALTRFILETRAKGEDGKPEYRKDVWLVGPEGEPFVPVVNIQVIQPPERNGP